MFGLYVASIALAVGIGAWQVGKEVTFEIGSASECKQYVRSNACPGTGTGGCGSYDTCKTVDPGEGADSCNTVGGGTRCWITGKTGCMNQDNQRNHAGLTYVYCNAGG